MEQTNIFNLPLRMMLVGASGQGKTTFIYNMIKGPLHRRFHRIYLFSINKDYDPKYKRLGISTRRMYDDYDTAELEHIFNIKPANADQWLIILDDCIAEKEFASNSPQSILNKLAVLGRLRGISLMVSVQKCCSSSTTLRNNINSLIVFPTIYDREIKAIYDICAINTYQYFKRMFHEIVQDSQYNAFLYDKRQSNLLQQIYQVRPEKREDDDPDSYNYRIFKYSYSFQV